MIKVHLMLVGFLHPLLILREHLKTKSEMISGNSNEWVFLAFTENGC